MRRKCAMLEPPTLNIFQAVRQGDTETVRYLVSACWDGKLVITTKPFNVNPANNPATILRFLVDDLP